MNNNIVPLKGVIRLTKTKATPPDKAPKWHINIKKNKLLGLELIPGEPHKGFHGVLRAFPKNFNLWDKNRTSEGQKQQHQDRCMWVQENCFDLKPDWYFVVVIFIQTILFKTENSCLKRIIYKIQRSRNQWYENWVIKSRKLVSLTGFAKNKYRKEKTSLSETGKPWTALDHRMRISSSEYTPDPVHLLLGLLQKTFKGNPWRVGSWSSSDETNRPTKWQKTVVFRWRFLSSSRSPLTSTEMFAERHEEGQHGNQHVVLSGPVQTWTITCSAAFLCPALPESWQPGRHSSIMVSCYSAALIRGTRFQAAFLEKQVSMKPHSAAAVGPSSSEVKTVKGWSLSWFSWILVQIWRSFWRFSWSFFY